MFAHQSFEYDLVYLIIRTPIVAYYVVSYRLDELRMQVVFCSFILQIGISIGRDAFGVVYFHVRIVGP